VNTCQSKVEEVKEKTVTEETKTVTNVDAVQMDVLEFLKDVDGGSCTHEMTQQLEAVVRGIRETHKKGKLKLNLTLEPFKGDANRIVVNYDVVSDVPKPAKPASMFFSTLKNTLQRTNPNQQEFTGGGFGQ